MFTNFRENELDRFKNQFLEHKDHPFPYVVIDRLLEPKTAETCSAEFLATAEDQSKKFVHYKDQDFEFEKYALNKVNEMPPLVGSLFENLHTPTFIKFIEKVTGLEGLTVDESLWGGGMHMTKKGGYLACHKDFSVLPATFKDELQLLRVINIIGYLNPNWKPGWGGELELWNHAGTESVVKVEPQFNRWVIFDTRDSYHGHPFPYQGDSPRLSIAAYYYQKRVVERASWASTEYLKLPWREDTPEYQQKRIARANAEQRYKGLL